MSNLRDLVIRSHIEEHYPNARIVSWEDPDCQLNFYTADQLHGVSEDWFPLCCYLDDQTGKAVYGGRRRIFHTYTEGETGAGKTSRFAMQSIRALSCKADKPSFLVVDIHGELAENLYSHLKENGYEIKILNCDDPTHSDTYNPFASLVSRCQESGTIDHEVISEIRKIAEIMQPVNSTDDPIWEQGARSYTNGAILDKFEDLLNGDILPECITLYNIIQNHYWIRKEMSRSHMMGDLLALPHYKAKGSQALSVQKMLAVTNNAEKTRASYFGVIENHYDSFGQPSMYKLSSSSTINVLEFIEKPTAIFIQSGSTRIGDDLISLMVNEIYNTAVRLGRESSTKMLPRKIHCFLDEFANSNIADGPEFIKMLTTSRKFGMYWHILLQCDAQLDRKFDANIAQIIRANCTELFMGSNDHETLVRFAKSCGIKTVESLGSMVAQQSPVLEIVDLITVDKLSLMKEGQLYIKTARSPLLRSYIEAFYKCGEFPQAVDIRSVYPTNDFDYTSTAFFPDDAPPRLNHMEFQVLRHIYQNEQVDSFDLDDLFPSLNVNQIVQRLVDLKLVTDDGERELVISRISPERFAMLETKHPNVPEPVQKAPEQSKGQTLHAMQKDLIKAIQQKLQEHAPTEHQLRKTLSSFSCLFDNIKNAFFYLAGFAPEYREEVGHLHSRTLHFELIEAYISNHNFDTKEEWVDGFRAEYGCAVITPIFPREFTIIFAKALREFTEELTLENIKEIRKIIKSGQSD